MDTVKFKNKDGIKMIAHRGVSGLEMENTCPAFLVAAVKGYYGIETDVHVTKDGKYILFHDDSLTRIFGEDKIVEESTFEELRAYRMTDLDGVTKRADLFMPTLQEYIAICKKYKKVAVLEFKKQIQAEHIENIVTVIKEMEWFENTTFISFFADNLIALRKLYPNAQAQFLTEYSTEENLRFMIDNELDADLRMRCLTKEYVDKLHAAGRKVNCWTVNTLEDAEKAKSLGVDFITTNILE